MMPTCRRAKKYKLSVLTNLGSKTKSGSSKIFLTLWNIEMMKELTGKG